MFSPGSVPLLAGLHKEISSNFHETSQDGRQSSEEHIHFGVDSTQNSQMAAMLNFCYSIALTTYLHRQSLGGASVICLDGGIRSAKCL